jgi:hypothetical protein
LATLILYMFSVMVGRRYCRKAAFAGLKELRGAIIFHAVIMALGAGSITKAVGMGLPAAEQRALEEDEGK